ncbi:MAG: pantoate--beta-alanine ligase [Muribaculaceae bacterium]|nr:pantoate--beta-alanine ligase [Muribaculaceae bacterium]
MKILRTVEQLRAAVAEARSDSRSIGLVPTMGALHDGHISLVRRARKDNDMVVVSIFVNPTQFNNPEDLRTYPRTEEADTALLEAEGVDYAFVPAVEEIYPEPDTRVFDLGPVAEVMEGAMRPGHFNGVAQIVSKLFDWAQPDRAYFGHKDIQQIAVIRRMAQIIGFKGEIVPCPIMREADGLAMSSRNTRLTPEQRAIAPAIHRALSAAAEAAREGASVEEVRKGAIEAIDAMPGPRTEYFEIVHPDTMQPISDWSEAPQGAIGCVTVFCGEVRLIDNIIFPYKGHEC